MNSNTYTSRKRSVRCIFTLGSIFLVYLLLTVRCCLSVELTDEAYGLAEIYNASFLKKPFIDIWDSHTGWFLSVPFMNLYSHLVPDLKGVFLYFRLLYLVLCASIIFICYKISSKNQTVFSYLAFFSCVSFVPFSIPQMTYNSSVSYLLILASCLLTRSVENENWVRALIIGIVLGVCCLLYPTTSIMASLLVPIIGLLYRGEKKKRYLFIISYCAGVAIIGLLFLLWILSDSSIDECWYCIKSTISTPHEMNKGKLDFEFINITFVNRLKVFFSSRRIIIWLLYFMCQISSLFLVRAEKKDGVQLGLLLVFTILSYLEVYMDSSVYPASRMGYSVFGFSFGVCLYCIVQRTLFLKESLIYIFLSGSWVIIYCLTSDNKNLYAGIDSASVLIIFSCCQMILLKRDKTNKSIFIEKNMIGVMKCYYYPLMLTLIGITCFYGYVYRDAPINDLDTKVETGLFAGLRTTKDRADFIQEFEAELSSNIDKGSSVFVANNMPIVYLINDVIPLTPQTWDAQYLSRGYTSAYPVVSYFDYKRAMPEVIVASDYLFPELYNKDNIEIWNYINDNYQIHKIIEIRNSITKIWVKKERLE